MKKWLSILFLILQAGYSYAQDFRIYDPAETTPYSVCVTINGDPAVQAGFCWFTNAAVGGQQLQIIAKSDASEADFASAKVIEPASEDVTLSYFSGTRKDSLVRQTLALPSDTRYDYSVNKAIAADLTPNTVYSYRVGKKGAWSSIATFMTAPEAEKKQPFSFLYITDSQSANFNSFNVSQKTIHAAAAKVPEAKFFLVCGDLVETGTQWEWEQWFSTNQDVWSEYLLAPAIGNHDYSKETTFSYHFNTPVEYNRTAAVKTFADGTNYSFVYGDALFMVLNYEDFMLDGYLESLAAWMERQVDAHPDTKWRIVGFHKTMFTGGTGHQKDEDVYKTRALMTPIFRKLKIDLALQGHDHLYEVIGPVNADQKLVPNAVSNQRGVPVDAQRNATGKEGGTFDVSDGTLFMLINGAGDKGYLPLSEEEMEKLYPIHRVENYFSLFSGKFGQNYEHGFCDVQVSSERIRVDVFSVDEQGNTNSFDSIEVVK